MRERGGGGGEWGWGWIAQQVRPWVVGKLGERGHIPMGEKGKEGGDSAHQGGQKALLLCAACGEGPRRILGDIAVVAAALAWGVECVARVSTRTSQLLESLRRVAWRVQVLAIGYLSLKAGARDGARTRQRVGDWKEKGVWRTARGKQRAQGRQVCEGRGQGWCAGREEEGTACAGPVWHGIGCKGTERNRDGWERMKAIVGEEAPTVEGNSAGDIVDAAHNGEVDRASVLAIVLCELLLGEHRGCLFVLAQLLLVDELLVAVHQERDEALRALVQAGVGLVPPNVPYEAHQPDLTVLSPVGGQSGRAKASGKRVRYQILQLT